MVRTVCTLNYVLRNSKNRAGLRRIGILGSPKFPLNSNSRGYDMATALHTLASLSDVSKSVADWVAGVRELTQPDKVYWCDGSPGEMQRLRRELLAKGELQTLNEKSFPDCYLYRSDPSDVARVEHLTFICTRSKEDAGPNNHWMDPAEARAKM